MYDLSLVFGRGHGRRHRHVLDTEAVRVHGILLADLRSVVQIFFLLNRGLTGTLDCSDARKPLGTAGSDVASDNSPEREAMDFWQRLSVHLPGQDNLVPLDFAPRHTHGIVVDLAFLEVCVCTKKFKMDVVWVAFKTCVVLSASLHLCTSSRENIADAPYLRST